MQEKIHNSKRGSGVPHVYGSDLAKLLIPVPPLEIQQEIVNILDKFTELQAELQARKKQYRFFRDKLLTFSLNNPSVVWTTLGEVIAFERPDKYIVKSTNYNDKFDTPVLTAGDTFILGYTNETNGVYQASGQKPVIIFDDFTTSFHWVDFVFKVKSSAMKILSPKGEVNFRFIYYAMKCIRYAPSNHARQWISTYSQFKIPLPPLHKQERIVKILDKFDALVNDISEGLPAEIKARQKQYEHYRNKLLAFKAIA
jgi:type I restriction enzyme S subunit